MTTDIRAHRDHNLELIPRGIARLLSLYCQTCDLFMTNLDRVTITIDNVTIKEDTQ